MARRICLIALMLAFGAVLNFPFAWMIAWCITGNDKSIKSARFEQIEKVWPAELGLAISPPREAQRLTGFGWTRVQHGLVEPGPPGSDISLVARSMRFEYGWPFSAMCVEQLSGNRPGFTMPSSGDRKFNQGMTVQKTLSAGSVTTVQLPLRPLTIGFVLNSLVYAAALAPLLWLARLVARSVVARSRLRRGLCPACGFPRGQSLVCTECGSALPAVRPAPLS